MRSATPVSRTIVRFTATVLLGLAGCVSVDQRPQALDPRCPVDTVRVCAVTGPATSCACETRANVDRFLGDFGSFTWPGAPH
jgi:hypothetical protein